jgi:sugar phosphate permease
LHSSNVQLILFKGIATCNENTPSTAIALLFLGTAFIGYTDGVAIIITTIEIPDQADIGIATGVMGALRSIVGAICSSIYSSILTNRLADTVPAQVPPALIKAGLPAASVAPFLQALSLGTAQAFASVKGLTPKILAAGTSAYKHAASDAYRTLF